MTVVDPKPNDDAGQQSQPQACLLYLLGELDQEATLRFERRLADDPGLCEDLLGQANLISAVAGSNRSDSKPDETFHAKQWQGGGLERSRWIAVLLSVAACLLLVFQVFQADEKPGSRVASGVARESDLYVDESTLIANAWASGQHNLEEGWDPLLEALAEEPFDVASLDLTSDDQPSDLDSTLSWMYVAVAASLETQTEEGNDG